MINQQLVEIFQSAPKHDDPEYTIFLRNLVLQYSYNDLFNQFFPIIEEKRIPLEFRFSAYYACSIFFRRNNKFEEMVEIADKYSQLFVKYPLNNIVLSFKFRYKAIEYHSIDLMYNSISYALKAKKILIHHKAVLHHFAETIATGLEHDLIKNDNKNIFTQNAIIAIKESIDLWALEPDQKKYAKNYATLGRLYIQKGDYDNGTSNILKSLNYEEGDNIESLKRIIKYNNYLYNAQNKKSIHNLHKQESLIQEKLKMKVGQLTEELEKSKSHFLEFLAFFSSIIALITCSTSIIAKANNFHIATCLIIILCGVIIFSFNIFSLLLETQHHTKKKYIIFAIISVFSVSLILLGVFLGIKLKA